MLQHNAEIGNPCVINLRIRSKHRPSLTLRSSRFQRIKHYLSEKVRVSFAAEYDTWGGTIPASDLRGVMRHSRPLPNWKIPCIGLRQPTICTDGRVRMCGCRFAITDEDELVIGNLNEKVTLGVILERTRDLIQRFTSGNRPKICRDCSIYWPMSTKRLLPGTQNGHQVEG